MFIRYPDHTLELTKSPNEIESVLEVHMSEVYINLIHIKDY